MRRFLIAVVVVCAGCIGGDLVAQQNEPVVKPNYRQAAQYSTRYLRQFMYDTAVRPKWIGETDEFWYSFRDSKGTHYYRVDPSRAIKEPLFNATKLASLLSEKLKKPQDANRLQLSRAEVNDAGTELTFTAENTKYVYDLTKETLNKSEKKDEEEEERSFSSFNSREEYIEYMRERRQREQENSGSTRSRSRRTDPNAHRSFAPDRKSYVFSKGHDLYFVAIPDDYEPPKEEEKDGDKDEDADDKDKESGKESDEDDSGDKDSEEQKDDSKEETENKDDDEEQDDTDEDNGETEEEDVDDDKDEVDTDDVEEGDSDGEKAAQDEEEKEVQDEEDKDNKDVEEKEEKTDDGDKEEQKKEDGDKEEEKDEDKDDSEESASDEDEEDKEIPIPKIGLELDETAVRLSDDGAADYSFAGRPSGSRSRSFRTADIKEDQKTRPSVSWSKDSQKFYVSRRDARGVEELWVINSLANPRPTLESYPYPMPGEEHIRTSELYYCDINAKELNRVEPKWTDEGYTNTHWTDDSKELRFIRRDRLLRNIEFCMLDVESGKAKCMIGEGFENTNISPQSVRYLEDTGEMIWWSERTGWGHFYLYDKDGNFKNAITSGEFRASRITSIDEKNRMLYFTGSGREPGENIYQTHLYSVRLDGSGLKLMDPGDASHSSTLSPSKQFVVDNCSRVDMAPVSILRDVHGNEILKLETADLSRLEELGWRIPETFVVKAADGVTDLYGNMWKPFDFDPKKRYPIIAHVYPGPQTEGTRHTFTATAGEQQLAQLGFVVIQVGHRGGTPGRSKAYAAHGYFNLRDYGLADKKAAIEQLAQRFPYIDVERVGIYGHSGGGFMTAAALLREPYNDFFKVGVSTAGNHDNNIYNNSWSERYHGLKVAAAEKSQERSTRGRTSREQRSDGPDEQMSDFHVEASDYFYEYEMLNHYDVNDLDHWDESAWWDDPGRLFQEEQKQDEDQKEREKQVKEEQEEKNDEKNDSGDQDDGKGTEDKDGDEKEGDKEDGEKKDDEKSDKKDDEKSSEKKQTRFEIEVPTNAELAENLKGHLFLIHGELDNNVHPANTLRLVDALIKANKRFDMLYLPATRHGFGQYQPYVTQRMYEYFAEHLLNDYQSAADISEKE